MASILTASVWNRSGCLVGQFERSEFGRACEMVEDSDEVCLDIEEWGEGAGGIVGLIDERQEILTGAEFVRLYGGEV